VKKITYPILRELVRYRKSLPVRTTLELLNERHGASWAESDLGGALAEAGPAYAAEAKLWAQPNPVDVAQSWILDTVGEEPRTIAELWQEGVCSLKTANAAMRRLLAAGKVALVNPGKKPHLYVGV
jgi:hypothetical protein